ncbi:MAG: hypothetical protein MZV64_49060 [Ignavibacteriales bacterium]|nr:hypothetical protein [Ignavibacteriales bacterium]
MSTTKTFISEPCPVPRGAESLPDRGGHDDGHLLGHHRGRAAHHTHCHGVRDQSGPSWASSSWPTLEIGYLTPPVGLNLFISSLRFTSRSLLWCGRSSRSRPSFSLRCCSSRTFPSSACFWCVSWGCSDLLS